MSQSIFMHYQLEEQPFVERIMEWTEKVSKNQSPILTDFLDPRQRQIVLSIVNSFVNLTVFFDGGYADAERVRAFIAPDYWVNIQEDFDLVFFKVLGENKFVALNHQDYLGALLNLGIKREKFGDILLADPNKQYIIAKEIAPYIISELVQIGKTKVSLQELRREELVIPSTRYSTSTLTVTSLRIDNLLSHLYNQPREKTAEWIKKNKVKVNWQIIKQTDFKLKAGDVISLRGHGRSKLLSEDGTTKKGRIKIVVGKLENN